MQLVKISSLVFIYLLLTVGCQGGGEGQQLEDADLESSGEEAADGNEESVEENQQFQEGNNFNQQQGNEPGDFNENIQQSMQGNNFGNENFSNNEQLFNEEQTGDLEENQANAGTNSNENLVDDVGEQVEFSEEELPKAAGKVGEANEFSGAPFIPGSLRNMVDGEAPEEYIVEYGDTLFDICSQLLGEGQFWPKLWSLNTYIKNPHFIWPGMRLRFYPGDEEEPPYIEVVQEEELVPLPEDAMEMENMVGELVLPERLEMNIQPTDVVGRDDIDLESENFESVGNIFNSDKVQLTLPGFIFPEMQKPECLIVGGAMGESMMGEERQFICRGGAELETGSSYTALRYVKALAGKEEQSLKGHLYQFVAHVKVEQAIGLEGIFLGTVTKSRLGLQAGDILVSYLSTRRFVSLSQNFSGATDSEAKIIAFGSAGQTIGGQGQMVFLDKGKDDGVATGQLMKIDQNLQYFIQSFKIDQKLEDTVHVGYLRIVDATDVGAVGYIIYNSSEVMIGDYAGRTSS